MTPINLRAYWPLYLVLILTVLLTVLISYLIWSTRHVEFVLSPEGLIIKGSPYGRTIPSGSIRGSESRSLDLTFEQEFRPTLRTNGLSLPGVQIGWFRLQNGEKALLFVTDLHHVVYLPTEEGFSILMSTPQPDELVRKLRQRYQ